MLLKPIVEGTRARFGVSVAETAHHDAWQRCEVGVSIVSGEVTMAEHVADEIERFVWQAADTEVLDIDRFWLDIDD